MELSNIGADLFGPVDAAILRVLAVQGRPLSGREIARLAAADPSTARRALRRWVDVGVVMVDHTTHASMYAVNRSHVLWQPLEDILAAPARLEQRIAELVAERGGGQCTAALYGSVVRGEATAESDVDIALILAESSRPDSIDVLVDDLRDLVEHLTGNAAEIVVVTEAQLRDMVKRNDPLAAAWAAEARTLVGTNLSRMIAEAR